MEVHGGAARPVSPTVLTHARRHRVSHAQRRPGTSVSVEVHVSNGLPGFTIVGLLDAAVREARDRVRAAVLSSGLPGPSGGSR